MLTKRLTTSKKLDIRLTKSPFAQGQRGHESQRDDENSPRNDDDRPIEVDDVMAHPLLGPADLRRFALWMVSFSSKLRYPCNYEVCRVRSRGYGSM